MIGTASAIGANNLSGIIIGNGAAAEIEGDPAGIGAFNIDAAAGQRLTIADGTAGHVQIALAVDRAALALIVVGADTVRLIGVVLQHRTVTNIQAAAGLHNDQRRLGAVGGIGGVGSNIGTAGGAAAAMNVDILQGQASAVGHGNQRPGEGRVAHHLHAAVCQIPLGIRGNRHRTGNIDGTAVLDQFQRPVHGFDRVACTVTGSGVITRRTVQIDRIQRSGGGQGVGGEVVRIEEHHVLFIFGFHDLRIAFLRNVIDIVFRVFRRLPVRGLNADTEGILCCSLFEGIALGIQNGDIIGQEDGFALDQVGFQHHGIGHCRSSLGKHAGNQDDRCILRRHFQGPIGVDHRLDGLLRQDQLRVFLGLVRNQTVTQQDGIRQFIFLTADAIALIAFDGMQEALFHICHQAHMVRNAVAVIVKEHRVAAGEEVFTLLGDGFRRRQVDLLFLQQLDPSGAAGFQGHYFPGNLCIVQAEGGKHGAPITIGIAVPLAIAGITLYAAILFHHVVSGAFQITQLALSHSKNILGPVACQFRDRSQPVVLQLQIRIEIHIAKQIIVDMLLQFTQQHLLCFRIGNEAIPLMPVDQGGSVAADQNRLRRLLRIRRLSLRRLGVLGDLTNQASRFLQAVVVVDMARQFLQPADQVSIRINAGFPVLMTFGFFLSAD